MVFWKFKHYILQLNPLLQQFFKARHASLWVFFPLFYFFNNMVWLRRVTPLHPLHLLCVCAIVSTWLTQKFLLSSNRPLFSNIIDKWAIKIKITTTANTATGTVQWIREQYALITVLLIWGQGPLWQYRSTTWMSWLNFTQADAINRNHQRFLQQ